MILIFKYKYWIKVSEDSKFKYSNVIFRLMYQFHSPDPYRVHHFQWFAKISDILNSCNFSNLWNDQNQYTTKQYLKSTIFETLDSLEQSKWLNNVQTNQTCFNYRIFKTSQNFENYLTLLPFQNRIILSKFRCKNNKIPANKDRFDHTVDRNCNLCRKGDIGDEFHYIMLCNFFSAERKQYLAPYFYEKPNTIKFSELFNHESTSTLNNLCKFISCIVKKFN